MSNTIVTLLTSSAVTAGLIPLCLWAAKFIGERQVRNASTAQQITSAAGELLERHEKDSEAARTRAEKAERVERWIRARFQAVLNELLRVDPSNATGTRIQREYDEFDSS